MARPGEVDQDTANQVVGESLGLSMEDLGANPPEDGLDADNADDNSNDGGNNQPIPSGNNNRQDDADDDGDELFAPPQERRVPEQRGPRPQPQPRAMPARAEVDRDARGNLVDKATGEVVARAGREARFYQDAHRARSERDQQTAVAQDLTSRLNKAVELGTQLFERLKENQTNNEFAPERTGLSVAEQREAIGFAKEAKADPIGTIKKLLTRAAAGGIDLSSIGLAGGNFDPKSLMDLVRTEISQHMTPLQQRTQRETEESTRQRQEKESLDASKAELNTFLTQNPEARDYLAVFQQVYSQPQFQHMSLGEVWSRLQLNLLRRNQPVPGPQGRRQRPQNQRNSRPPNGGQGRPPQGGRRQEGELAPVTMSYEDIVRGLLPPR